MNVEIEIPPSALRDVFESDDISVGMTKQLPGEATIRLLPGEVQHRSMAYDAAPIFTALLNIGKDVSVGIISAWLYDRLKRSKVRRFRVNRRFVEEITPESIRKSLEESIEQDEQ